MEAKKNIKILNAEMDWLLKVIDQAICTYLLQEGHEKRWTEIPLPDLSSGTDVYSQCVKNWNLNIHERLALVLSMAPHLKPEALDIFFGKNQIYDRGFTEFGGVTDRNHSGFLPTVQTLCFLISSSEPEQRSLIAEILGNNSSLIREQVITVTQTEDHIPQSNGTISLNKSWFHYFFSGEKKEENFDGEFPAQKITTNLDWEDVILGDLVTEQVQEINTWIKHGKTLMNDWGLNKKIKPGYRALFYGPPGTGKTLTATLLGKASQKEVYRIDLSMVVSKYIGETEKNLSKIFSKAKHKEWILFFDEADSLFGKRTATNSSNDRHANQQTAHLLQEIEDFPGIVILASNLRSNMDEAFTRRFQTIIQFEMPSPDERYLLWKNAFSGACRLDPEIDLYKISEDHELAGGAIINVLRYCAMSAINRNSSVVNAAELFSGIKREFKKENKTVSITFQ